LTGRPSSEEEFYVKRNRTAVRVEHDKNRTQGTSKYAAKVKAGNQMYGPGCCAHRIKSRYQQPTESREES